MKERDLEQDIQPRDIAGPLGPVDPHDMVMTSWTRGYRQFEGAEREIARRTDGHRHDRLLLWYRLLTLFDAAFARLEHATEDDYQNLDELNPLARELRLRLLAMAGGTSKMDLDGAMAGYYSQCFGLIRHMIESFFQIAFVRHFPEEAVRWFDQPGGPAGRLYVLPYDQVKRRVRRDSDEEDQNLIDYIDQVFEDMHKGAHPSSILLGQMVGEVEGTIVVGASYKDEFAIRVLDRGIAATYWLLGEMQHTEPMSDLWKVEFGAIFRAHQAMLAGQRVAEGDEGDPT
jgi:hypothetical protein